MWRQRLVLLSLLTAFIAMGAGEITTSARASRPAVASDQARSTTKPAVMRTPINWRKSSETVAYPDVDRYPDLSIKVSLEKQRMYLMDHQRVLYTMYASTGVNAPNHKTPRGTYHVQAERGKYFYSTDVGEGAYYWVSWLNHGEYLFHATPVNAQKHYIRSDAADLGKKPSSHGCVHLSVADAKWVYDHIKVGTKVVID